MIIAKAIIAKTLYDYWKSFSFIGLVFAVLFFSASVTPSLLPRTYYVQGILSAFAIAFGYGIGVGLLLIYQFLQLPNPGPRVQRFGKWFSVIAVAAVFVFFTWQMTAWQNVLRALMEMPPIETAYPIRMAIIAIVGSVIIIGFNRFVVFSCIWLSQRLNHVLPQRVAMLTSTALVAIALVFIGQGIVARGLLNFADEIFLKIDQVSDEGVLQPTDALATGSTRSLVDWETIGRQGKIFLTSGPTQQQITEFWGREAKQPLRVYVGKRTCDEFEQRASLALQELIRVGAFQRSILILVTPTGTGWVDPGGVDTVEYLHAGDTAIVSTQYSYVPSWVSIIVDPKRSVDAADSLFDAVYRHWKSLPHDARPRLYLHGLSLGSLGSEQAADLYTIFEDPIQGAVWSGPPFPSTEWNKAVAERNPGTPAWLPTYRDQRLLRFTAQKNTLATDKPWGPMRNVYIQYASDPMVFFSTNLFFQKPAWLGQQRGPDVSPALTWFPIVTGLQVAFDLPMATSIPIGYGHNYAPANYIDAWIAVSEPKDWSDEKTERLKKLFTVP